MFVHGFSLSVFLDVHTRHVVLNPNQLILYLDTYQHMFCLSYFLNPESRDLHRSSTVSFSQVILVDSWQFSLWLIVEGIRSHPSSLVHMFQWFAVLRQTHQSVHHFFCGHFGWISVQKVRMAQVVFCNSTLSCSSQKSNGFTKQLQLVMIWKSGGSEVRGGERYEVNFLEFELQKQNR